MQYEEAKSLNGVQRDEILSLKDKIKNLNLDQALMTTKLNEVKIENEDLNNQLQNSETKFKTLKKKYK